MEMSDNIADLATALAKAQALVEGARKDADNPAFKRDGKVLRYADLASVWAACRQALTDEGLSVVQFPGAIIGGAMTLTTQISHSSGQWMRDTMSIPLGKVDAHGVGSALTYARRYSLAAVVGVSPEDDDGNAASRTVERTPANDAPAKPTKLDGPHTSKTALKAALHGVMREIEGCGDLDQFDAFIAMPETKATIAQCERDAPEWAVTGKDMPAEFVPLLDRISMTRTNLSAAANDGWRDDMTRAG